MPIAHCVPGGDFLHGANDPAGRADHVGLIDNLHRTFGMHEDFDARILLAELGDMLRQEHLVHAAMPLPQDHAAAADRLGARCRPVRHCADSRRAFAPNAMPIARAVFRPRC